MPSRGSTCRSERPWRVQRFETEARAAGTLDHPNLLVVYDVGREGAVSYIVSELLDGETLRVRLRNGAVPNRQEIDYGVQIARGLAAAHERGIVHRDLKPENLFLTLDGRLKILDFGVAKLTRTPGDDALTTFTDALTDPGSVVGTVGYMAPEQVRGEPVDHRADIFALGIVIHEMLSGQRPFRRETTAETMTAILKEEAPELPAGAMPAVERILGRCLEKRRDDRFHSAHDLALALDVLATTTTSRSAVPARQPTRVPRVTSRVVSPDGSTIAARGPTPAIRLYPVDGTTPRELAGVTGSDVLIGWIGEGLLIRRPGDPRASRGEIYRVDTRTGGREFWKNILPRDPAGIMVLVSFCVTPDGRSSAYSWHRALSNMYVADGLA